MNGPAAARHLPLTLTPGLAVVLATLALLAIDLGCVLIWGRDIPLAEDWLMVPDRKSVV